MEVDLLQHLEQKRKEVSAIAAAAEMARAQALSVLELQRRAAEIDAMANGTGPMVSFADAPPSADFKPRSSPEELGSLKACGLSIAGDRRGHSHAESSLSAEDRRRFGLPCWEDHQDCRPEAASVRSAEGAAWEPARTPRSTPRSPGGTAVPNWSSLSAEDRRRFGLDAADAPEPSYPSSARGAAGKPAAYAAGTPREAKRFDYYLNEADGKVRRPDLYEVEGKEQLLRAVRHHPEVLWGDKSENDRLSMARTLAQLEAVGITSALEQLQESERKLQRIKMRG